jgi:alpha-galactosidase
MDKLKKINPDIMIEFRQSYIGPAISKYGNMFRVTDCPCDPIYNRVFSIDLRFTSAATAVHSDMIMWNKDDTNESVMHQLLSVMFAVPQISVRFDAITDDHKRLLKAYLDFWRANRDVLLNGDITAKNLEANYTMAESKKDGQCVAVLYENVVKCVSEKCEYIFNSTAGDGIYADLDSDMEYSVYDMFGVLRTNGTVKSGVCKLDVKSCEMVKLTKI